MAGRHSLDNYWEQCSGSLPWSNSSQHSFILITIMQFYIHKLIQHKRPIDWCCILRHSFVAELNFLWPTLSHVMGLDTGSDRREPSVLVAWWAVRSSVYWEPNVPRQSCSLTEEERNAHLEESQLNVGSPNDDSNVWLWGGGGCFHTVLLF